jgi:hypothetical protein
LKIVGVMLPMESNCVSLADETDQYGLRIPRITYSWCDNDRRLINNSLSFMSQALEAVDAKGTFEVAARRGADQGTSG